MFASRWHSPPKPLPVLSWTTGMWRPAMRSASIEPWTSPSSTPTRRSKSRSDDSRRVVLPAPGALIRLTTRTPLAVEVVAIGASDRLVCVERVLCDLDLRAVHALLSLSQLGFGRRCLVGDLDRLDLQLAAGQDLAGLAAGGAAKRGHRRRPVRWRTPRASPSAAARDPTRTSTRGSEATSRRARSEAPRPRTASRARRCRSRRRASPGRPGAGGRA